MTQNTTLSERDEAVRLVADLGRRLKRGENIGSTVYAASCASAIETVLSPVAPAEPVAYGDERVTLNVAKSAAWRRMLEMDDRNSPEEYPEMILMTQDELFRAMDEAADATPAQPSTVMVEARGAFFRHKERGTVYEVLGSALVQMSADIDIADDEEVTVYRGDDGRLWVRPTSEFYDGRFEEVAPPAPSPVTSEPKSLKRTMTIDLTDEEMAALEEIAKAKDLEPPKVFRAMLKTEQLVVRGLAAVSIEGGPLSASPVTGALVVTDEMVEQAARRIDPAAWSDRSGATSADTYRHRAWKNRKARAIAKARSVLTDALAAQKAEG